MNSRTKLILRLAKEQPESGNIMPPESNIDDKSVRIWKIKTATSNVPVDITDTDSILVDACGHGEEIMNQSISDVETTAGETGIPCSSHENENINNEIMNQSLADIQTIALAGEITIPCSSILNENLDNVAILSESLSDEHSNVGNSASDNEKGSLTDPYGSDDSQADPNFTSGSSSSPSDDSEEDATMPEDNNSKKRRVVNQPQTKQNVKKRKCNKDVWQKNQAKFLRNSGLPYQSLKIVRKEDGIKDRALVSRDGKQMLPPCNDKCRLKCSSKFIEEDRQKIFKEYLEMADLQRQRDFISSSMMAVTPKYRYEQAQSSRSVNNAFYLDLRGQKIRVCKLMFMATLGINSRIIRTVLKQQESRTKRAKNSCLQADVYGHIRN